MRSFEDSGCCRNGTKKMYWVFLSFKDVGMLVFILFTRNLFSNNENECSLKI